MSVRDGYKMTELGEIPQEWEVNNAGSMFETVSIKNCPNEKVLTVTQDRGTIYRDDCGINIKTMDDSLKNFKLVQHGNFIISLRSFQGGIEYSTLRGIVSPAYTILTNTKPISDGFYKYFYKSEKFITLLDSAVIGIRDGKQISYEVFKNLKLPYPPLSEQKRIAEILSSNDALITKTDELIEKTKEVKQGLMQELLTKGIGHTEFKDSELGRIPKEWEVKKFKDITQILRCGVASTPTYFEEGIPFLSAQNVKDGRLDLSKYRFISKEYHEELTKKDKPLNGDILYSRVGAGFGEAAIVDIDFEFSVYVSLTLIRMKNEYHSEFYKHCLNSAYYKKLAKDEVFQGGGVPNLNVKVVEKFDMIVPPIEEQVKITNILNEFDNKLQVLTKRKQQLEEIKQGLMQDLLAGRVRVNLN